MKRTWRAGRVILAVLLLSLIGAAFYVWPMGPRWAVERERPLGFDLKHGLLFTINYLDDTHDYELHGYDLASGQRTKSMPLGLTERYPSDHPKWMAILSEDCSRLACWNESDQSIMVLDVHQESLHIFSCKTGHISVDSISLSCDGSLLAFRGYDEVQIWDCTTGTIKKSLKMPVGTTVNFRTNYWVCRPYRMEFSNDGRFLAVGGDHLGIVVFDIESGLEIGQCPNAWMPHFLPDNKTLMTLTDRDLGSDVNWYELGQQKLNHLPRVLQDETNKVEVLGVSRNWLFTVVHIGRQSLALPSWVPVSIRQLVESLFKKVRQAVIIKTWDSNTGKLFEERKVTIWAELPVLTIAPDGLKMAVEDNKDLSLWDIPPRRSLTCWLICISFALIALWAGYPRRQKAQTVGVTP